MCANHAYRNDRSQSTVVQSTAAAWRVTRYQSGEHGRHIFVTIDTIDLQRFSTGPRARGNRLDRVHEEHSWDRYVASPWRERLRNHGLKDFNLPRRRRDWRKKEYFERDSGLGCVCLRQGWEIRNWFGRLRALGVDGDQGLLGMYFCTCNFNILILIIYFS